MPHLDSNIPSKTYAATCSEILRNVRTTAELISIIERANLLLIWMKNQCSECTRIISLLKKIHLKVFHKFADTADKFITLFSL